MKHVKIYDSNTTKIDKLLYTIYINDDGSSKLLNTETSRFDFTFDNIEQLLNIDTKIQSNKYNL